MLVILFQSRMLDAFFDVVGACVVAGVPAVALLIIVIVASTIMRRRWTGEPRPFRRRFGIGAALLSCFLAVAPPFLITLVLAGEHGQTAEIMSTAALFWIPAFAVAIPAVIQAVRLARRNRV